jgi:uncharacterized protein (TIRG00374 family)
MDVRQEPNQTRRRRTRFLLNLIGLATGLVLLGWLLARLDLNATARLLEQTNRWWFLAGCLLYLINCLARAYRFVRLARAPLRHIPATMGVVLAMSLANQVLPARLGELSYVYLAHRSQDLPVGRGVVSLVIARLFDLLTIGLLFVAGAWPAMTHLPPAARAYLWIALGGVALVVAIIAVLVIWYRTLCRLTARLIESRALARIPGRNKIGRLIEEIESAMSSLGGLRQYTDLMLSSLAVWASSFAMLHVLLLSLDVQVAPSQTLIGATAATLTSVLPINSLGNFGTLEAGWTGGFLLVGMDLDLALSTGFAVHLQAIVYALAFGLPAWAWSLWRGCQKNTQHAWEQ